MPEFTNICGVCLEQKDNLTSMEEIDENNINWYSKLSQCVPEIIWAGNSLICIGCIEQLQTTYSFRNMCLKVHRYNTVGSVLEPSSIVEDSKDENRLIEHPGVIRRVESNNANKSIPEQILVCPSINCSAKHDEVGNGGTGNEDFCEMTVEGVKEEILVLRYDQCDNNDDTLEDNFRDYGCESESSTSEKPVKPVRKRGRRPKEKVEQKPLTCEVCGSSFSTKYILNRHIRNVHATEKPYACETCGQKFASPVYLRAHKKYHIGERSHICSFCGKGFITASDLYHHEKTHANKRAYKCAECPKAFNTSSDLHKHKICVHYDKNLWKYVCTYCERKFPLKTNLDTHLKVHTGERTFHCHLCEKSCISKSVLQRHIESHSNIRSFKCGTCGQEYKYQKSLDIHNAKAHGIGMSKIPERTKKYICHMCPKSYYARNKLEKHIRSHTGDKPFQCLFCSKRFTDNSYLKHHTRTAHKVTE